MPAPFKTLTAECALHLTDGTVYRFTSTAALKDAKGIDDVGAALGVSVVNSLGTLGGKVDAIAMKELSDALAKADAKVENLTKKLSEALRPEPPRPEPPKQKTKIKAKTSRREE